MLGRARARTGVALVAAALATAACGIKTNQEFQAQATHTDVQSVDGSPKYNYDLILPQMRRCYTDTATQFDDKAQSGEISISARIYAGIVGVVRVAPGAEPGKTKITTYSNYPLWRLTHSAISLWVRGDKATCPIGHI